ncbi:Chitin synthase, class 2 [Irineochytrium annulatum]|nr:Chitin synthase, class 2 [Irineochytrium annulatum]
MSGYSPVNGAGDSNQQRQQYGVPYQPYQAGQGQQFPGPPPGPAPGFAASQPYVPQGQQHYGGGQHQQQPVYQYQNPQQIRPSGNAGGSFAPSSQYASSSSTVNDPYGYNQNHQQKQAKMHRGTTTLRRTQPTKMVQKEIELTAAGNFILDVPVAKSLLKDVPYTRDAEFTHLRYTAVTCDANEYPEKYQLRAKEMGRRIRLAVVVTMYNEDDVLFGKSYTAIMKNIAYLCSGRCAGWDKDGWKDILVCIVSDGRAKVNPLTLNVLGVMGCYADGLAKASVNGQDVKAHIFEFTNQITVRRDLSIRRPGDEAKDGLTLVPCQTVFLLKEKNAKKINSHRWFFNAVCNQMVPDVCILIDVGTKPTKESFYHLYRAFERNPNVAGACGEIAAELGPMWKNLLNPIVAVQNFEYKMSNILDKPLESSFGYISVLPGAFSAYRFTALQGEPLKCYFKGENPHGKDVKEANMYLAEDRILCFELVVKADSQNILKYVKSARAETDVPDTLHDLIKQRRRWLNGSFFASVHATLNWQRIFRSGHTGGMKWLLLMEFIYNGINLLFSWFNLGNFFLAFYFLFNVSSNANGFECGLATLDTQSGDPFFPHGAQVFDVLKTTYLFAVVTMFIASLGNRPEGSKILYTSIAILFGLLMFMMLFMGVWTIKLSIQEYNNAADNSVKGFFEYVKNTQTFRDMVISTLATYGLYLISSVMHLEPWHVFTCMIQYLFMLPSFINILMVYSFCNLHDVSWGTKGIDSAGDLNGVTTKTNKDGTKVAVVEVPSDEADVDAEWEGLSKELMKQKAGLRDRREDQKTDLKTEEDDFFKQFRTNTLMLWLLTNGILVYVFTSPAVVKAIFPVTTSHQSVNPYLTFLFWSVACLSAIRFLASTIYLFQWWGEGLADAGKRNPVASISKNIQRASA